MLDVKVYKYNSALQVIRPHKDQSSQNAENIEGRKHNTSKAENTNPRRVHF